MRRFISSCFLFVILFFYFIYFFGFVFAEDPTNTPTPTPNAAQSAEKSRLEQKISEYQKKLDETRKQRDTLDNQLKYLDTQAYVTSLKIEETENKMQAVKKEAEILTQRIDTLDDKLDTQWRLFLATTYATYKQRPASIFDLILNSENAEEMLSSLKYHSLAQSNRQRLLIQTQETKINFEEQKSLREKKQQELTQLQDVLAEQKSSLETQQESKKVLISATKNRENEYQNIIAEAQRQISAFKSFTVSTGTNIISAGALGSGVGGYYYSQRDERWANMRMGDSGETVLDVGCFISSLSMVLKYYGYDYTPATIASSARYFYGGSSSGCFPTSYATAYACTPNTFNGSWPGGLKYREIGRDEIDGYLNRGIPVISSVRNQSHYVVLKRIENGEYIMNDPIYGPDLKVSDYYSISGRYAVFE
ncbi:MAG: C39 family peptidase [Patescibacteria group bacterium]